MRAGRRELLHERIVSGAGASVVETRAVRAHGDGRQACLLFDHVADSAEVGGDDGGHRRADKSDKRDGELGGCLAYLGDEIRVAAHDGVHVAQARAEYGGRLRIFLPARLVEAADIARAAARIDDDRHAAERVEHGGRAGRVRRKRRQGEREARQGGDGVALLMLSYFA